MATAKNKLYKVNEYHILAETFDEAIKIFRLWRPEKEICVVSTNNEPVITKNDVKELEDVKSLGCSS